MKICAVLLVVLSLAGCAAGTTGDTATRVHIRSGGEVDTTYELGDDGKILRSSTADGSGGTVTRRYSYDGKGVLASVSREDASARTTTVVIAHETDAANGGRTARTLKTGADAKGLSTELVTEYHYGDDGKLEGILQTDASGNVQAKCVED